MPDGYSDYMTSTISLNFHTSLQNYELDVWSLYNSLLGLSQATGSDWLYNVHSLQRMDEFNLRSCTVGDVIMG